MTNIAVFKAVGLERVGDTFHDQASIGGFVGLGIDPSEDGQVGVVSSDGRRGEGGDEGDVS